MPTFGVTPTGFVKKTLADIKSEMEAAERANIDAALNLASSTVFGQLNGIFGDKLRELWDVAEGVYRSLQPDSAEGDAQDAICALANVKRKDAVFSSVVVTCAGTPGTILLAGRVISIGANGARFASLADATIPGGGSVDVAFEAEEVGSIAAPSGTLTTIVTPVSGWASCTNALDAELGAAIENDSHLRRRRITAIKAPGDTLAAVQSAVAEVPGVITCTVFENTDSVPDASGVPGHAFEVIVEGGADADIAAAIYAKKPAGIQAYGNTLVPVIDSQGAAHTIGLSRPAQVQIYVVLTVVVNPAVFGAGISAEGIVLVQEALAAAGDALAAGQKVVALKIEGAAFDVDGVTDVTGFAIGTAPSPTAAVNIPITNRERAEFDTSRITVAVAFE